MPVFKKGDQLKATIHEGELERLTTRPATDAEVAAAARDLVGVMRDRDQLDEAHKEASAEYREQRKGYDSRISGFRKTIEEGTVEVTVVCDAAYDFDRNSVTVFRPDTGEILEERAMTAQEREQMAQPPLPSASRGTTEVTQ